MRSLGLLLLPLLFACPTKTTELVPDTGETAAAKKPIDPVGTSSVTGTVRFDGTPPEATIINAAGDGACVAARPGSFDAGDVKVKDGKVENAFVWISAGLESYGFDKPTQPVEIDQRGCMYQPRIVGVRADQDIVFINSDQTIHNIKSQPKNSKGWNFATPPNGKGTRTLTKQEVMVRLGCDVHPWMTAWVGVVEHPYFAVTDAGGRFEFAGLPPGSYTVSGWHERLGSVESKVTVEKAPVTVELVLPGPK